MHFTETKFRSDSENEPGPDFSDLRIEHPERVNFYKTNLGRALFFNTDISEFNFDLVQWRQRGHQNWMRRSKLLRGIRPEQTLRLSLFEEYVALENVEALRPQEGDPDERNYQLIAATTNN